MGNIWITGCFGFIGNNLFKYLVNDNEHVFGVGRSSTILNIDLAKFVIDNVTSHSLNKLVKLSGGYPELIYHCAGSGSVGNAQKDPLLDFESTIHSCAILLDWVRINCPSVRVIISSSAAVYGDKHKGNILETDLITPFSVYGYNKFIVESLCNSYIGNYSLDIVIARLFSVYGEGLNKQLLFDFCTRIKNSDSFATLNLFGTGDEVRDWIHVTDVIETLILLGKDKNFKHRIVNVGTGNSNTVKDLISLILNVWFEEQHNIKLQFNGQSRLGDPLSLLSDNTLRKSLCKSNDVSLIHGVQKYVKWYKANIC